MGRDSPRSRKQGDIIIEICRDCYGSPVSGESHNDGYKSLDCHYEESALADDVVIYINIITISSLLSLHSGSLTTGYTRM